MAKKKSASTNPIVEELEAMSEAEAIDVADPDTAQPDEPIAAGIEQGADADEVVPAELTMLHTDTVSAQEASGEVALRKAPRVSKKKKRSARYLAAQKEAGIDPNRNYPIDDAIEKARLGSYAKFDAALEVHISLSPPRGKKGSGDAFRTVIQLPHGTGKEPKIAILDETLIEKIKKDNKTEFEILIATPALMPKVAQIAKILGPQGKMPNPKTGTVVDDPETAKKAILSGRVELREDANHNLHQAIGRVAWDPSKLRENFDTILASLPQSRIAHVTLAATMGLGVRVRLEKK